MDLPAVLDIIKTEYSNRLMDNLVGIYIHGSIAMGCYNPEKSDIDFLVVVNEKPSFACMRSLIDVLLVYSQDAPRKGFEMSTILREDAANFTYPTPFVLHYSNFHKESYRVNPTYICGGMNDPDLAAHIMVTRERGIRLCGEPIDTIFAPIPKEHYTSSIISDIADSKEAILSNPTYYILNLCRVVYYLREERVSSKREGGLWGCKHLPFEYRDMIQSALIDYDGRDAAIKWNIDQLQHFAGYMLEQMKRSYPI